MLAKREINYTHVFFTLLLYTLLAIIIIFTLFPFLWLVVSAFKPREELFTRIPSLFIKNPTIRNVMWALGSSSGDLLPFFWNSVVVTIFTIIITITLSYLAGFAIARYTFPGITIVIGLLLFSQMFQGPSIMVAWYKMAQALGIINTRLVLVLIYCTSTIPISTFLLSGFIRSIPRELDEAAMIDGASKAQQFAYVTWPSLADTNVLILVITTIQALKLFTQVNLLTQGGPAGSTNTMVHYIYDSGFRGQKIGYSSAASILVFLVVLIIVLIQRLLLTRKSPTSGAGSKRLQLKKAGEGNGMYSKTAPTVLPKSRR